MNRRKFTKSVAAFTCFGSSSVSARSNNSELIPASEVGIDEEVSKLLRENKVEKAKSLLDEYDVEYSITEDTKPIFAENQSSDDVSTASRAYLLGEMKVTSSLVRTDGSIYLATGSAQYEGRNDQGVWGDVTKVPDVCGFDFNSSVWASINPTLSNVNMFAGNPHKIRFDEYLAEEGLSCKVYLEGVSDKIRGPMLPLDMYVQTRLEHIGYSTDVPVTFVYRHTKATLSRNSPIKSIDIGNALTLNLKTGASEVWNRPAKAPVDLSDGRVNYS